MVRKYTHHKSRAFKNTFITASFTLKHYVQSSHIDSMYIFLLKSGNPSSYVLNEFYDVQSSRAIEIPYTSKPQYWKEYLERYSRTGPSYLVRRGRWRESLAWWDPVGFCWSVFPFKLNRNRKCYFQHQKTAVGSWFQWCLYKYSEINCLREQFTQCIQALKKKSFRIADLSLRKQTGWSVSE